MKSEEDKMDQLDRYLEGNMTEAEKQLFESRLESDSELRDALKDHKLLIETIESAAMKDTLSQVMAQQRDKGKAGVRSINRTWIAVAASVVILFGAFFFLGPFSGGGNLYEEYYQPDPGLPTTMSTESNLRFTEAMVQYKQGEYRSALAEFDQLMNDNPASDTLLFYRGICHMELDQPEVSAFLFNQISTDSRLFGEKAQWYRALALLQDDNTAEAIAALQVISDQADHRYHEQANTLLEKL